MIYRLLGKFLKRQRIRQGYTLRRFCQEFNLDAVTISKIERGFYFKESPEDTDEFWENLKNSKMVRNNVKRRTKNLI